MSRQDEDWEVDERKPQEEVGAADEDLAGDEEGYAGDGVRFRDFVRLCPNCGQAVSEEADSCPFCGDILFRHLTDGMFAPRRGFWTKLVAGLIVLLVAGALLGLVLQWVLP